MINGFVLDIKNLSETEQVITLFQDAALPDGLSISTIGETYDHSSLVSMAQTEGFRGCGFLSSFQTVCTIDHGTQIIQLQPGVLVDGLDVVINGTSDLVVINVPAGEQGVFQLVPCTEG